MPVFMQYEVDRTKSKVSGRRVSHTPNMGVMETFHVKRIQLKNLL